MLFSLPGEEEVLVTFDSKAIKQQVGHGVAFKCFDALHCSARYCVVMLEAWPWQLVYPPASCHRCPWLCLAAREATGCLGIQP